MRRMFLRWSRIIDWGSLGDHFGGLENQKRCQNRTKRVHLGILEDHFWSLGLIFDALGVLFRALELIWRALGVVFGALGPAFKVVGDIFRASELIWKALGGIFGTLRAQN